MGKHYYSAGLLAAAAGLLAIVPIGTSNMGHAQPAEAFAALPVMSSPAISADGARLAFITSTEANNFIIVSNIDGMAVTTIVDTAQTKPQTVFWVNDEALVFTAGPVSGLVYAAGQIEPTSPYGVDLRGEAKVTRLLQDRGAATRRGGGGGRMGGFPALAGSQLMGYERSSGRVLYPMFDDEGDRVLYAVDPADDRRAVIDRGGRFTVGWAVDESGKPLFRSDYAQQSGEFTLMGRRANRWEPIIADIVRVPQFSFHGLTEDGALVAGTRPADVGRFGLYELDTETGRLGGAILAHDRYDVGGVRIDPYTNRVVGAGIADVGSVWFDDELVEHQGLLDEAFPGESPFIASWSEDRSRFIVTTDGEARAPAVYLYDAKEPSVAQIASVYAALEGAPLPARRPYTYAARDGTEIPAYLTRPLNAAGPTPLVLLPHGGPAARDVGGFHWMAHFLATRGYTVLQPNFRGSGGYGNAWENAGHGQWGTGLMQHDLSDAVAALVEEQLVDPERVCIVGTSYGGYAALAGAVFTPELYRCAAAIAPVADLGVMLGGERDPRGAPNATVNYWRRAMGGGDPEGLNERLRAASPALFAGQAAAPVLLIHPRDDAVVPLEQSRIMERALQGAGKRVEFVELDGEDHWLSSAPTRLAALRALERFLAENLGE
jgi:dipeptidyl aminopeptidase/acylaminoacyl peptidase